MFFNDSYTTGSYYQQDTRQYQHVHFRRYTAFMRKALQNPSSCNSRNNLRHTDGSVEQT